MVKLTWTELSTEDLRQVFDYIAKDSSRYASITVNKIYSRAQDIIENPYVGRIVPELNDKIISSSQVDILRVYHSARLLKSDKLE